MRNISKIAILHFTLFFGFQVCAEDRKPASEEGTRRIKASMALNNLNNAHLRSSAVGIKFLYLMQQEAIRQGTPLSRQELTQAAFEIRSTTKTELDRIAGKTGSSFRDAVRDGVGTSAEVILGAIIPGKKVGQIATKLPGVRLVWQKVSKKAAKAFNKGIVAGLAKTGGKVAQSAVEAGYSLVGLDAPGTDERVDLSKSHVDSFDYIAKNMDEVLRLAEKDDAFFSSLQSSQYESDLGILTRGNLEQNLALNENFAQSENIRRLIEGQEHIIDLQEKFEKNQISKEEFVKQLNLQFSSLSQAISSNAALQSEVLGALLQGATEEANNRKTEDQRKTVKAYADSGQMVLYAVSMMIGKSDPRAARVLNAVGDAGAKLTMLIFDLVAKKLAQTAIMSSICFVAGLAQIAGELISAIIGGPSELEIILDAIKGLSDQLADTEARLSDQMKGISNQITSLLHVVVEGFAGMEEHLRGIDGSLDLALTRLGTTNKMLRDLGFTVQLSTSDLKVLSIDLSLAECAKKDEATFINCIEKFSTAIRASGDSVAASEYLPNYSVNDNSELLSKLGNPTESFSKLNMLSSLACLLYGDESMGANCSADSARRLSTKPAISNPSEWSLRTQLLLEYLDRNQEYIPLQKEAVRKALDKAFEIGNQTRGALSSIGRDDGHSAILEALDKYSTTSSAIPNLVKDARHAFAVAELGGYDLNANPELITSTAPPVKALREGVPICDGNLLEKTVTSSAGVRFDASLRPWAQQLLPDYLALADQFGNQSMPITSASEANAPFKPHRLYFCIESIRWVDNFTRGHINSIANTRKNLDDLVHDDRYGEIPLEERKKFDAMYFRFKHYLNEVNETRQRLARGEKTLHEDNLLFTPEEVATLDAAWKYLHTLDILPGEPERLVLKYVYQLGRPTYTVRVYYGSSDDQSERKKLVGWYVFKDKQYYQYGVGTLKKGVFDPNAPTEKDGFQTGDYPHRVFAEIDLNKHMHYFDVESDPEHQSKYQLIPDDEAFYYANKNLLVDRINKRRDELQSPLNYKDERKTEITVEDVIKSGFRFEATAPEYTEQIKSQLKLLWAKKRQAFSASITAALSGEGEGNSRTLAADPSYRTLSAVGTELELHRRLLSSYLTMAFPESVYSNLEIYEFTQFDHLNLGRAYFREMSERVAQEVPLAESEPNRETLEKIRRKVEETSGDLTLGLVGNGPMMYSARIDPELTDLFSENEHVVSSLRSQIGALVQARTASNHVSRDTNQQGNIESPDILTSTMEQIDKKRQTYEAAITGPSIQQVFFELKSKLIQQYGK